MGNFYTNIVVPEPDADAVASLLERSHRRAYVAGTGTVSIVYDSVCDDQDLDELQKLTRILSGELQRPALAFCNHDDDVLWFALAQGGRIIDVYNSYPGYFDESGEEPSGGDADRLCAAFGAMDQRDQVSALLEKPHEEVGLEIHRHLQLLDLLGLPRDLLVLGYRYVSRGELEAANGSDVRLEALGGAPMSGSGAREPHGAPATEQAPARENSSAASAMPEETKEAKDIVPVMAALAFGRIDVPERYASILGAGQQNGYTVVMRLQRYIVMKGLGLPMGTVRSDDLLVELLGEREFGFVTLPRLVARAFKVAPLPREDAAALARNDLGYMKKFTEALKRAMQEGFTDPEDT